jgi:hypothetical protein
LNRSRQNFLTIEQARKNKLQLMGIFAGETKCNEQVMEVDLIFWFPTSTGRRFLELGNCSENIQQF